MPDPASIPPDVLARLAAALADRYRFERELGQGGMSTVYLAEDLKHHRKVAVKVLRPELAASMGAERFLREIQIAAQLQHPHILPLLDSGEARSGDGAAPALLYYVMPYVDGESLRSRLEREGELPIPEAVRILTEATDALAYAHSRGLVHRDIKPDNILLSGRHALVTDFGVAKAVSEATGQLRITTAGLTLGTPAYMAPEQAVGEPNLDQRVDIYALGAMGYELLTGKIPFTGKTAQQVLAAHVTQPPVPVEQHRAAVPPELSAVIMKCLAKDPADRWQSGEQLLTQLEPLAASIGGRTPASVRAWPLSAAGGRRAMWLLLGAATALLIVLALALTHRPPRGLVLGKRTTVTLEPGLDIVPTVSPDGRLVAYVRAVKGERGLFVSQVEGGSPVAVATGTTLAPAAWAPDGGRLLFGSQRGLEVVPALGGTPRLVVAATPTLRWGAWSPRGDQIAYASADTLYLQDLSDGQRKMILVGREPHSPAWSPDGEWIAYVEGNIQWVTAANIAPSSIWLVRTKGGTPIRLTNEQPLHTSPVWLDNKRLLFVSNRDGGRDVYLLTRSGGSRAASPEPVRVTTGLNPHTISLSADGRRLVYAVHSETANLRAFPLRGDHVVSLASGRPITSGAQVIEGSGVSPDGKWIAFDSDRNGSQDIFRMPIDGSSAPEVLTSSTADEFQPTYSPDGRHIAFHLIRTGTRRDMYIMPSEGGPPEPIQVTTENNYAPRWSPDGRSLSFLCGFPDGTPKACMVRRTEMGAWLPVEIGPVVNLPSGGDWAADGSAYSITQGPNVLLQVPGGGAPRLLGSLPEGYDAHYTRRSADGRTMYVSGLNREGVFGIWALPMSGGTARQVVASDGPSDQTFRHSFDVHGDTAYVSVADRQSDVFAVELDQK